MSGVGEWSMMGHMLVVHVHVRVRPDDLDALLDATLANARASLLEPGVVRFDVLSDQADPAHVVLVEVYRDAEAAAAHKSTAHYATWRDAVAEMMAEPRASTMFSVVFPDDVDRWAA
jgi:(4S)-4-hydroxy-5-phosphonooxypentane-2,3-dione isomerase